MTLSWMSLLSILLMCWLVRQLLPVSFAHFDDVLLLSSLQRDGNHQMKTNANFERQPAIILWKGLSLIDSWTHLIQPSRSSSVAVERLAVQSVTWNSFWSLTTWYNAPKIYMFALAHSCNWCLYLCPYFVCLWVLLFVFVFVNTNSPIVFMVALDNSAIIVRLAALDNLSHVAIYLEHPLFSWYLGS